MRGHALGKAFCRHMLHEANCEVDNCKPGDAERSAERMTKLLKDGTQRLVNLVHIQKQTIADAFCCDR
jgi:hypothetical protein